MKIYGDLAKYWPMFSAPEEYADEARVIGNLIANAVDGPLKEALELGSGGGNLASHLIARGWAMTLTEPAPGMLAHSRKLNPSATHLEGDMRTLRLGRTFDAVLVHDAVMYMTTPDDLRKAMETAFIHCRPGGVALIAPDAMKETFEEETDHGGHDAVRFLSWSFDPDPADTTYEVHYALLVREGETVRSFHDVHLEGLFPQALWLDVVRSVGFSPEIAVDEWRRSLIVARKTS